jgi:hypothetical protein
MVGDLEMPQRWYRRSGCQAGMLALFSLFALNNTVFYSWLISLRSYDGTVAPRLYVYVYVWFALWLLTSASVAYLSVRGLFRWWRARQ